MTTTEYLVNCLDEAHGSLVAAAKIAHLEKHPEAAAISKLIDALEDIHCNVSPDWYNIKELTNDK
jgi:hypothetical protein